jgi:hypothetical protein
VECWDHYGSWPTSVIRSKYPGMKSALVIPVSRKYRRSGARSQTAESSGAPQVP